MRSGHRSGVAALVLAASVLALAGCSGEQSPSGRVDPGAPLPAAPTAAPAQTAGPLDSATLPAPSQLGAGWKYRVEGEDPEDGAGNGSSFQRRDPDEIAMTTIPMGCEVRSPSPVPEHVLQATYLHAKSGSYAVALRMRFDTPAAAAQFAEVRAQDLATCRDQPADPYSGEPAPVLETSSEGAWTRATYRLVGQAGASWRSLASATGTDVLTLDTDADPGKPVDWERIGD